MIVELRARGGVGWLPAARHRPPKFGLTSASHLARLAADDLIRSSAAVIDAPVLMHVQWDDEIFPRAGQFELFDLLTSPAKRLRVRAGGHTTTRPDDETAWCGHLRRLTDATTRD